MTQMFGMKLVYENRPYMHIDMENTIVMKIEGKQVAAPHEEVPAAAPVAETKPVVEQQRTVHTEEKALPAARRVAAPTTAARAAAPAPAPTPVIAAATPVVSSPSKKPLSAVDTGSSTHNYLIAGVIVAGIASVIAMVVMRKK
jgi:hypothetical protein